MPHPPLVTLPYALFEVNENSLLRKSSSPGRHLQYSIISTPKTSAIPFICLCACTARIGSSTRKVIAAIQKFLVGCVDVAFSRLCSCTELLRRLQTSVLVFVLSFYSLETKGTLAWPVLHLTHVVSIRTWYGRGDLRGGAGIIDARFGWSFGQAAREKNTIQGIHLSLPCFLLFPAEPHLFPGCMACMFLFLLEDCLGWHP